MVDNPGIFRPLFFDIPMYNSNFLFIEKHTQKGHFLIRGKKGRGSSTPWALCVHVPARESQHTAAE